MSHAGRHKISDWHKRGNRNVGGVHAVAIVLARGLAVGEVLSGVGAAVGVLIWLLKFVKQMVTNELSNFL